MEANVTDADPTREHVIPVIDLGLVPRADGVRGRPFAVVVLWTIVELLFVSSAWQPSSSVRIWALRAFGADIGRRVIMRPRTRVKFPWKLHIGDHCWIGEGVWFHNQDHIYLGHDVVVSQETMLTTGSHAHRRDMALLTRPIHIDDGAWVASRCVVLGGSQVGRSALIEPLSLVRTTIPAGEIWGGRPAEFRQPRFRARRDA
jgi:putative colanic acid biosynthesis acetyltransferase WcaF